MSMKKIYACIISITGSLLLAFSAGLVLPVDGWASCGSSNCFLVVGTQEGIIVPGQVILDLSYRFIPMDRVQEGSKKVSEALVPRIDFENGEIVQDGHKEIRTNNELVQLDISYGVISSGALMLSIPFFNLRTHEHAHVPGDFSRQDGTSGFGDVRLIGKYAFNLGARHLLVGGVGIKAPTGEYKLLDHEGEINEPTIMPGTGSWDGLVSAYYAYQIRPRRLEAFLSGSYQIATENDLDYRFGNTVLLNSGISYLYGFKDKLLAASLQINMRQSPHDEFDGEEVPSTGGRLVYITPGVKLQASPGTAIYAHVQLPVYQYVNELNIVPRYGLILGLSQSF